jgi:hypothetical protein
MGCKQCGRAFYIHSPDKCIYCRYSEATEEQQIEYKRVVTDEDALAAELAQENDDVEEVEEEWENEDDSFLDWAEEMRTQCRGFNRK